MALIQGSAAIPRRASQVLLRLAYYLLACLLTMIVTGVLFLLRGSMGPELVALLYLVPVTVTTALWGLGPGIASALLAFLSLNYFFIEPYYSLLVHQTQDLLGLVVFLGIAVGINQLLGWTRRNLAIAEVRQHEAMRLYELASHLSGMQEEEAIARALASQIQDAFQAQRVEVLVEAASRRDAGAGCQQPLARRRAPPAPNPAGAVTIGAQPAGRDPPVAGNAGNHTRRGAPAGCLRRSGRAGAGKRAARAHSHANQAA